LEETYPNSFPEHLLFYLPSRMKINDGSGSKNFDPGWVGSIFCSLGRVSHLWFRFEFGKFPLKTSHRVWSKSTWVKIGSAFYLLRVKSKFGSGQGPSLQCGLMARASDWSLGDWALIPSLGKIFDPLICLNESFPVRIDCCVRIISSLTKSCQSIYLKIKAHHEIFSYPVYCNNFLRSNYSKQFLKFFSWWKWNNYDSRLCSRQWNINYRYRNHSHVTLWKLLLWW